MEEGSLLQHALDHQRRHKSSSSDTETNTIVVDIFILHDISPSHLLRLAELAWHCNQFLQSKDYLWHYEGDGHIFGVHATEGIPHLRACCKYGPCIQDEWTMIDYAIQLTQCHFFLP